MKISVKNDSYLQLKVYIIIHVLLSFRDTFCNAYRQEPLIINTTKELQLRCRCLIHMETFTGKYIHMKSQCTSDPIKFRNLSNCSRCIKKGCCFSNDTRPIARMIPARIPGTADGSTMVKWYEAYLLQVRSLLHCKNPELPLMLQRYS